MGWFDGSPSEHAAEAVFNAQRYGLFDAHEIGLSLPLFSIMIQCASSVDGVVVDDGPSMDVMGHVTNSLSIIAPLDHITGPPAG